MHILIVEDNEMNQKVIKAILKKNNISFELASDGQNALEILNHKKFDLILMDCQMPILDGYETTVIIRENEKKENLPKCPIIAITANAMSGDKEKCINSGMDDFLSKPIQSQQVIKIIEKWVSVA